MQGTINSVKFEETSSGNPKSTVRLANDNRYYTVWPDYDTGKFDERLKEGVQIEAEVGEREYKGKTYYSLKNIHFGSQVEAVTPPKGVNTGGPDKFDTMLLSYAKDLTVAMGFEGLSEDEVSARVRRLFGQLKRAIDGDVPF